MVRDPTAPIEVGETVLLIGAKRFLVTVDGSLQRSRNRTVDTSKLIGVTPGSVVIVTGSEYRLVRPHLADLADHLKRGPQWIPPKDVAWINHLLGAGPGQRILEVGTGSGMLTCQLAWSVGETGRVVSVDHSPRSRAVATTNLRRWGLLERVDLLPAPGPEDPDAPDPDLTGPWDGVVTDVPQPQPWVEKAIAGLHANARAVLYLPSVEQSRAAHLNLKELGFLDVTTSERIEREWVIGERSTRPDFAALGHSGFVTVGRWLGRGP